MEVSRLFTIFGTKMELLAMAIIKGHGSRSTALLLLCMDFLFLICLSCASL